jgi:beta-lactamase class D
MKQKAVRVGGILKDGRRAACWLFLAACAPGIHTPSVQDLDSIVTAEGVDPAAATLVIIRLSDGMEWVVNAARAEVLYPPASTSKIPHSLIALETGLAVPDTEFKWDGTPKLFKGWSQDQTLTTAYKRSAAWVFQDITAELGQAVMSDWLTRFDYGNHDIGSAADLTTYWLLGPLKISAQQQTDFLTALALQKLPLSKETYEAALPMFKNENRPGHILYAKTGWMQDVVHMDIGWFVGWVETPAETYVFAYNMDMPEGTDGKIRKIVVISALQSIGAWEG